MFSHVTSGWNFNTVFVASVYQINCKLTFSLYPASASKFSLHVLEKYFSSTFSVSSDRCLTELSRALTELHKENAFRAHILVYKNLLHHETVLLDKKIPPLSDHSYLILCVIKYKVLSSYLVRLVNWAYLSYFG